MGREARTLVDDGTVRAEARVHLDSDMLTVGPPFRVKLKLDTLAGCIPVAAGLEVRTEGGRLHLAMPAKEAAAWAKAMMNPPSLATKLGLRPGMAVAIIGAVPDAVSALMPDAAHHARLPRAITGMLVFAALPGGVAESALARLRAALSPGAALWLIYEKGTTNGDALIYAARGAGLKDTKVARIDERHTALRFIAAR